MAASKRASRSALWMWVKRSSRAMWLTVRTVPAARYPTFLGVPSMPMEDLRGRVQRLAARSSSSGDRDLTDVRASLDRLLRRAVGYDAAALSTVDPATFLWTSC